MRILAGDTSTSIYTVAVCEDDRLLAETVVDCGRTHSERLIETVDWVLKQAGTVLADLDALAVAVGPGSFTGLRIGVAAWKGLALSRGLPLVPVPTLDAMTHVCSFHDGVVCPLLDARMGEVYGAVYRFEGGRRAKVTADRVGPLELLVQSLDGEVFFVGDGAVRYRSRLQACLPDAVIVEGPCATLRAGAVAKEALHMLQMGVCTDAALVAPVYLRKSQAEVVLEGRSNHG